MTVIDVSHFSKIERLQAIDKLLIYNFSFISLVNGMGYQFFLNYGNGRFLGKDMKNKDETILNNT